MCGAASAAETGRRYELVVVPVQRCSLLAGLPWSRCQMVAGHLCCAVRLPVHRRSTAQGQQYGEQQMLDLELDAAQGEMVLGARLVMYPPPAPPAAAGQAAGSTGAWLLVLTARRLIAFQLHWK